MEITEDILQFIWRFRLFRQFPLQTSFGDSLRIVNPGRWNADAGPDFLMAQLEMEGHAWHGHVEVHVHARDWALHGHQHNPAYNAVLLHVVWDGEEAAWLENGSLLPCLQLCDLVDASIIAKANTLLKNINPIPCAYELEAVPSHVQVNVLERMAIERLEQRYAQVLGLLKMMQGDWERLCLALIAAAFGMKVNKQSFIDLSQILQLNLLRKLGDKPLQVQSLFFGQAGWLQQEGVKDAYVQELRRAYSFLERAHHLSSLSPYQWKFLRMRPYNFPTFKLAQLAALYTGHPGWFAWITHSKELAEIQVYVSEVQLPTFWEGHYHFEKEAVPHSGAITNDFFHLLVINSFALLLFTYGKYTANQKLMDRALSWLEQVPAERNKLVLPYKKLGMPLQSAMDSQAILQLQAAYCDKKRCLHCGIGASLIKGI